MPDEETTPQLSEREHQVLQMVATGASNQQIARELVISINTVKVHMRNIFEKLGVQSRTEAVMVAVQQGWVAANNDDNTAPDSGLKTFLSADTHPPLSRWQQMYFVGALLLAMIAMISPLMLIDTLKVDSIYIPIIPPGGDDLLYKGEPTATPLPPPATNSEQVNRWSHQSPMLTQRAGLGIVAFDGQIFAIGGVRNNDKATRSVEIYNPAADAWSEGAAKPTATTNVNGAVIGNKVYVPGGCTNDGQAVDNLEIYNPQTDTWKAGQNLPQSRCGYGLVAIDNKLYLLGGWDGESFTDTIFVYTAEADTWESLEVTMPRSTGYMGAAALENKIYIAGGYDGQQEFNQTYLFDPATKTWTEKAPMNSKRGGLGLINAANVLYAIGGGWNEPITTSEKYNPAADVWSSFEAPFEDQWRNAGLTVADGKIYAIGGWNNTKREYMDSVVSYQVLYQLFIPSVSNEN